jgi:acetolactate synthase regulatory subunit
MPPLSASAADADLPVTAFFFVHARAEPGVMPRVLELFAKRGLVPTRWHSAIAGSASAALKIEIAMEGLRPEASRYIAACLRQIADVETVVTAEGAVGVAASRSG